MGRACTLKAGDVIYRVDPRSLSIKVFKISAPDEVYNFTATTYENFSMVCEKKRFQLPKNLLFPLEFKGRLYFLTEQEANSFIKSQVGL
ncbi:hypothetical protein GGR21_002149 [Dysgonomonas hofstadii]|uniref:Uncharacterized protein n=1 Tax=Dysgonomonas hofstadii TaxID=637886 RepID=A0A840CQ87_9BACT|nr:hypothetical protein [Dysgonomonas hofstadii]MBB4036248.1 hypothetical protein [Dysgonomonas hofstadii]